MPPGNRRVPALYIGNTMDTSSIIPLKGLGQLRFGASVQEIVRYLGRPPEDIRFRLVDNKWPDEHNWRFQYERWSEDDFPENSWDDRDYEFRDTSKMKLRFLGVTFGEYSGVPNVLTEFDTNSHALKLAGSQICGCDQRDVLRNLTRSGLAVLGSMDIGYDDVLYLSQGVRLRARDFKIFEITWSALENSMSRLI